jgi:MFS family permease
MNYRFVVPLLTTALFEQVTTSLVRVTISYRVLELGLSEVWLGVITAAFAVLPMLLAVTVGRFIDRGNEAQTAWIGGVLMMVAALGFWIWQDVPAILFFTTILGMGHLMLVISQQVLCTKAEGKGAMERMIGNYMVANAIGQGIGPVIVGWAGGSASIPPTELLFAIGLVPAALTLIAALMLRPGPPRTPRPGGDKPVPVRKIASIPGIRVLFLLSIVTVAAQDLVVVYLPVLGAERGMSVDTVGALLAGRAIASMASRVLFARLNEALGRWQLLVISTFAGAFAYVIIALPLPLWLMHIAIASAGFTLGVSVTGSIATLLALATADARGTANSLRMMGNRVGQFVIPFLAGLVAAASGTVSIFLALGVSLAACAGVTEYRRVKPGPDRPE